MSCAIVYLNSLLATLNARWLFQKQTPSDHLSIPLSSVTPTHVNLTSQTAMSQPVCPAIFIQPHEPWDLHSIGHFCSGRPGCGEIQPDLHEWGFEGMHDEQFWWIRTKPHFHNDPGNGLIWYPSLWFVFFRVAWEAGLFVSIIFKVCTLDSCRFELYRHEVFE